MTNRSTLRYHPLQLLGELHWMHKKKQKGQTAKEYRQRCSDVRAVGGLCPYADTVQCAAKLGERIGKPVHNMFRPDYFISRVLHSKSQASSSNTDVISSLS